MRIFVILLIAGCYVMTCHAWLGWLSDDNSTNVTVSEPSETSAKSPSTTSSNHHHHKSLDHHHNPDSSAHKHHPGSSAAHHPHGSALSSHKHQDKIPKPSINDVNVSSSKPTQDSQTSSSEEEKPAKRKHGCSKHGSTHNTGSTSSHSHHKMHHNRHSTEKKYKVAKIYEEPKGKFVKDDLLKRSGTEFDDDSEESEENSKESDEENSRESDESSEESDESSKEFDESSEESDESSEKSDESSEEFGESSEENSDESEENSDESEENSDESEENSDESEEDSAENCKNSPYRHKHKSHHHRSSFHLKSTYNHHRSPYHHHRSPYYHHHRHEEMNDCDCSEGNSFHDDSGGHHFHSSGHWSRNSCSDKPSPDRLSSCPMLYTRIGKRCVAVFSIAKVSWWDASNFCESIFGELISFLDFEEYFEFVNHIKLSDSKADLWIGGKTEGRTWKWVNGKSMPLGSPYWAIKSNSVPSWSHEAETYYQAPAPTAAFGLGVYKPRCASMPARFFYYINDEDCESHKSPVCVLKDDAEVLVLKRWKEESEIPIHAGNKNPVITPATPKPEIPDVGSGHVKDTSDSDESLEGSGWGWYSDGE